MNVRGFSVITIRVSSQNARRSGSRSSFLRASRSARNSSCDQVCFALIALFVRMRVLSSDGYNCPTSQRCWASRITLTIPMTRSPSLPLACIAAPMRIAIRRSSTVSCQGSFSTHVATTRSGRAMCCMTCPVVFRLNSNCSVTDALIRSCQAGERGRRGSGARLCSARSALMIASALASGPRSRR